MWLDSRRLGGDDRDAGVVTERGWSQMTAKIRFTSFVDASQRSHLESLVFFNSSQQRVLDSIVGAIEKFGPPEIVVEGDRMRIRVQGQVDAQSLFAVDEASGRPLGIVVFLRSNPESLSVLHIGIAEDFTAEGSQRDQHLLLRLIGELRRSGRRVKGVKRIELLYLSDRTGSRGRMTPRKLQL